ncbi:bestrophin family protein [Riemerella anatipestifer]|uniref:bestrophin family protein n=1 Tax=Riemerella anatipestifer TaxID=34085 RepID=UPI0021D5ED1E|nr:bestrophin family protein [Riemerella anatipestifer]MCU7598494.1 bestrophin family protein [Riemerella anatipestifer]MCW0495104.1 bestrophin family protein [Riemerella anatipestifer]MCW0502944.1 bestrophin family protein [Riemerella anatipestifer]
MIKTEKQGLLQLFKIASPYLIYTTLYAIFVLGLEELFGDHIYKISGQIGSVFGLAIAFFLGFRMNSAYDRWWEARKIFGELTNNSRSFVAKIYAYYSNDENINLGALEKNAKIYDLIQLTIAYIRQFKNEIHNNPKPIFDEKSKVLLEKYNINEEHKISNELLVSISKEIEEDFKNTANIEKSDLMQHINRFYDIQGKAERIKNTPFLMIYSAFTKIIVNFYVILIPLFIGDIDLGGEKSGLEFLAIPIMVIISTSFLTINKLANLYGEPFSENKTSVTVTEICNTIESNCKEVQSKLSVKN